MANTLKNLHLDHQRFSVPDIFLLFLEVCSFPLYHLGQR